MSCLCAAGQRDVPWRAGEVWCRGAARWDGGATAEALYVCVVVCVCVCVVDGVARQRGVVVITSALHAEGRWFNPGR